MKVETVTRLKQIVPIIRDLLHDPDIVAELANRGLEPDWTAFNDFAQAVAELSQTHATEILNPPGPRYL